MTLYIVCEDQLSEAVMRKMVAGSSSTLIKDIVSLGKKGRGYIKKRINDFNNQNALPFFVLADLDKDECAPVLIKSWMRRPLQQNIVFRIAVREVESWLLADTKGFSGRYFRTESRKRSLMLFRDFLQGIGEEEKRFSILICFIMEYNEPESLI